MPRETRAKKAKRITGAAPAPLQAKKTRALKAADVMGTIQEYAVTCPCCGLMAPFKLKVPGSDPPEYVDRFTGEPYKVKLFSKHYGGKTPAEEGTPIGRGNKAAKGILNYTDVTGSEPGIFADVLEKIKQALGKEIAWQPAKVAAPSTNKRSTSVKRKPAKSK